MTPLRPHDEASSGPKPGHGKSADSTPHAAQSASSPPPQAAEEEHFTIGDFSGGNDPIPGLNPPLAAFPKVVPFTALARCGDEVWIENDGQIYRLRRTRQGKLILTK